MRASNAWQAVTSGAGSCPAWELHLHLGYLPLTGGFGFWWFFCLPKKQGDSEEKRRCAVNVMQNVRYKMLVEVPVASRSMLGWRDFTYILG